MTFPRTDGSLLEMVRGLAPLIRQHQGRIESEQTLPRPVVDALVDAGVFRTHAPREIGGLEVDALTYFEIVEALSQVDASVGWLAMINCGNFFSWFPPEVSEPLFHVVEPYAVASGNLAPKGRAQALPDGGYRVTGRWSFVSGCPHAEWILLRSPIFDGETPRLTQDGAAVVVSSLFAASEVIILPTWNGLGLRGSGSHDVTVTDVLVPPERTTAPQNFYPTPLFACWFFLIGHAAHAVGIARTAIQALIDLSRSGAPPRAGALATRAEVQMALAEAEATLRAARAFIWDATAAAYGRAVEHGDIEADLRMHLKLAITYAVRTSAAAVKMVYDAAGPPVVYETSVLERCFRDIHTATQHSLVQTVQYQFAGQYLFTRDLPGGPFGSVSRALI